MYHQPHSSKPQTPSHVQSKSNLIQWLRNITGDVPNNIKIQDLGTGVLFCKLINNYFPNAIPPNRIIAHPKNQYENTSNLKLLQNSLVLLKISIPTDVRKIGKMKFLQNWNLLNALYRHFNSINDLQISVGNEDSRSIQGMTPFCTTKTQKRTFQQAFMIDSQFYQKQTKESNCKEHYNPNRDNLKRSVVRENRLQHNSGYFQSYQPQPQFQYPQYQHQHPHFPQFNQFQPKSSTGKQHKENSYVPKAAPSQQSSSTPSRLGISSPMKGKWSVSSQFFQNNHHAIIDRVKQILLKSSHDTEKIRQVKMLMNIPIQDDFVKVEEQEQNGTGIRIIEIRQRKPDSEKAFQEKQNLL